MRRNLSDPPRPGHNMGAPPGYIKATALVLSILANALGFGGDKLVPVLDRASRFVDIVGCNGMDLPEEPEELYAAIQGALEDDLDAYSVAVGFAAALNISGSLAMDDAMKKGAKDN